jgi:predicted alpha/beta superfamily hydrolase
MSGAEVAGEGLEYFPAIETHLIVSQYVNQTFKIQVMQPAQRTGEATQFPALYAADGNFTFDALKGISHSIQRSARDAPRFVLVGIGYPSECPLAGSVLRVRDLTFPSYPKISPTVPAIEGVLTPEEGSKEVGGAEDFQKFIARELIPFIDRSYGTRSDDRAFFGHSGGGTFGLYTMFTNPRLFNRYIVSSPALIFNGRSSAGIDYEDYDFVLEEARRFIASRPHLERTQLYMSVGAEEQLEPGFEQWQLTRSFHRMVTLVKAARIAGLELMTEELPGETHMTVWPSAFTHGVQAVFGTRVLGKAGAGDV